ncbi:DUF6875 domain-containing protein [Streptomyces sp. NPDC090127]|uniref:DUF6875 domain-containing protein n=1 Tax=Streptomyces sp. NPDC090127 TaxID=3365953 RepID=UPI0037FD7DDA
MTSSVKADRWCAPRPLGGCPGAAAVDGSWRVLEEWVRDYLCRPHPDLGRRGPVCPYTRRAMEQGALYGVLWPHPVGGPQDMTMVMQPYVQWFERRCGEASDHALLVGFPALPAREWAPVIEGAQRLLKPSLVRQGLMIGEFHDGPPSAPGVRNPAFRPLSSPLPLLALRRMVRSDGVFLADDPEHRAAYRARFPHALPYPRTTE